MVKYIIKNNGKREKYDREKATMALWNSFKEVKKYAHKNTASSIVNQIEELFKDRKEVASYDWGNAAISFLLSSNKEDYAKNYASKMKEKEKNRLKNSNLMVSFKDILESEDYDPNSINSENANIKGNEPMSQIHRIASETNKEFVLDYLLNEKWSELHRKKWLHIHDLDFYELTYNCLQVDLKAALHQGFSTGNGFNTEPRSINTAAALSAIIIQSCQNSQYGGISLGNLDEGLAPYVNVSFKKALGELFEDAIVFSEIKDKTSFRKVKKYVVKHAFYGINLKDIKRFLEKNKLGEFYEKWQNIIAHVLKKSNEKTIDATKQAMQGFSHNLNTLRSRAANQVPFSSVNLGLDVSEAGRLVTKCLLETTIHGSGDGSIFIYPIIIFHVLDGINWKSSDKNYDLMKLAIESSSVRFYPNYVCADSPYIYCYMRNKKGKLLWKTRENYYVENNLINKEEIPKDFYERIKFVSEKEKKISKAERFDLFSFISGREIRDGVEFTFCDDKYCEGLDMRTITARMGCRTLTIGDNLVECDCFQEPENYHYERNVRPPYSTTFGKGNFAFVTINLPHLALQASKDIRKENKTSLLAQKEKSLQGFYNYLLDMMIESKNILLHKREIMNKKTGDNFSFVVGQHMITDTQNIGQHDLTEDIWKHFSLSIGYIGIYETLKILYGKKQTEINEKGIEIVSIMRTICDAFSKGYYLRPKHENWWESYVEDVKNNRIENYDIYSLKDEKIEEIPENVKENFALFSTPAEGLCNTSCKADLKTFGEVKNITDKGYYTNSHHIDVREPISFEEKAKLEAPYHQLCNAGTIFYVEADSIMHHNPKAYKEILSIMKENDLSYCAVNVPLDECCICHSRGEFEEGKGCPYCGAKEDAITRTRRVTGYLTGSTKLWNQGKREELKNRTKHIENKTDN